MSITQTLHVPRSVGLFTLLKSVVADNPQLRSERDVTTRKKLRHSLDTRGALVRVRDVLAIAAY